MLDCILATKREILQFLAMLFILFGQKQTHKGGNHRCCLNVVAGEIWSVQVSCRGVYHLPFG